MGASLRSRPLESGRKRERVRVRETREGWGWGYLSPRVSPSPAPGFSCAHYFQAPATQAKWGLKSRHFMLKFARQIGLPGIWTVNTYTREHISLSPLTKCISRVGKHVYLFVTYHEFRVSRFFTHFSLLFPALGSESPMFCLLAVRKSAVPGSRHKLVAYRLL